MKTARKTAAYLFKPVWYLILLVMLSRCAAWPMLNDHPPQAVDGILDLRNWNFEQAGPVKLNGEWEFYWAQLLTNSDFAEGTSPSLTGFFRVPGRWKGHAVNDTALTGVGYATYRLTVLLSDASAPTESQLFAIKIPTPLLTAYALYVDGHLIDSAGSVGSTAGTMIPQVAAPHVVIFAPNTSQVEIIIQLSNFYQYDGGIVEPLYFGPQAQLYHFYQQQLGLDFFLIGSIFVMGLYYLGLFGLRRTDKSPLYFGLFCLATTGRVLVMNQPGIVNYFVSSNWPAFVQTVFLLIYAAMITLALFTRSLFPQEFSKRILSLVLGITAIFVMRPLFAPLQIYTAFLPITLYSVVISIYVLYVVGLATARQREGAFIFLLGHIALFLTIINDVLFFNGVIQTHQFIPLGLFVLIGSQAYILSSRFSRAFTQTETLSLELQINNQSLKQTQQELHQSEEKYRTLFEDSKDVIFITRLDGQIEEVNPVCFELFGYTRTEARQMNVLALYVDPQDRQRFQETIARDQVVKDFEVTLKHKHGRPIDCQITATLRRDEAGNISGYQGIIHDMTAYKQAEAERTRALAMQRDKEAADAANRAKSAFLANMSHELRTPLNAILGFSRLMSRGKQFSPTDQENLRIIIASGEHLLTLINQVLDLSKVEAGRMRFDPKTFDLHQMLIELEGMFRLRAKDKGLHLMFDLQPDLPRYIDTDNMKLRQVLINLLNNALKFTDTGNFTLRVSTNDETSEHFHPSSFILLTFKVSDTGPGIAPEEMDLLFQPFTQTQTGRQAQEGTGLGLTISRKLVHLLGGELTAQSPASPASFLAEEQREDSRAGASPGTTFKFDIQVKRIDSVRAEPHQTAAGIISEFDRQVIGLEPGQPRYRILIADDRENNRRLLHKLLTGVSSPQAGFELQEAENGQQALEIWQEFEPHLIWLDMRMPVLDGYEVAKRIKATRQGQATVIVALTASAFEEEQTTVLAVGCDDFLRKPFVESDIFRLMNQHIGVQYIYDTNETRLEADQDCNVILTPEDFASLSPDLRSRLAEAIDFADIQVIEAVIQEIRLHQTDLAPALQRLVDNFEYDKILALIHN